MGPRQKKKTQTTSDPPKPQTSRETPHSKEKTILFVIKNRAQLVKTRPKSTLSFRSISKVKHSAVAIDQPLGHFSNMAALQR